jgi:hypothetical protein
MAAIVSHTGVSLSTLGAGMLTVSKVEIQQEAHRITQTAKTDDEIREDWQIGWESELQFDKPVIHVSESDSLLSVREREQLRRDMARKHAFQTIINSPV